MSAFNPPQPTVTRWHWFHVPGLVLPKPFLWLSDSYEWSELPPANARYIGWCRTHKEVLELASLYVSADRRVILALLGARVRHWEDRNATRMAEAAECASAVSSSKMVEMHSTDELQQYRAAAREFVERVEKGEVRSKRTYARFKDLLALSRTTE